jgi:triphosphatase
MGVAQVSRTDVEVEWQLDALDLRPVERWFAARFGLEAGVASEGALSGAVGSGMPVPGFDVIPQPAKRLFDTYYDTADWRLARSGYVLRTRRRGGGLEATMKDLTPASDGLRRRMEATETLAGPGIEELDRDGPVGRRVRALAGGRTLSPVLEVRTRRRLFALVVHEEAIGEVALDDTVIVLTGDPQRLRLQRVEVEVQASWVDALQPLVEQLRRECGLQPATLSKFEAGLLAAGVALPGRLGSGIPPVGPGTSLGDLAFTVIGNDIATMLRHEPGTRLGEDPEGVHQMRVATRRLRAALDLFNLVLPTRAQQLRVELGWLADVLGAVRDLDIQLGKLEQWCHILPGEHGQALDDLGDLLTEHREAGRARLLEALDSRRYERMLSGLDVMVEQGPPRRSVHAKSPAVTALPELIGERHRAAVRAAKRAQASRVLADFHRLRIRCKRLRYAIEFTSGLYGNDVKRFAKQVAALQDSLGLIQDADVAYGRLRAMATTAEGAALSRPTVFAMGMVAERCREEADSRLGGLAVPTAMLRGPGWRRAAEALEDARATAADHVEQPGGRTRVAAATTAPPAPRTPAGQRRMNGSSADGRPVAAPATRQRPVADRPPAGQVKPAALPPAVG